MSENAQRKIAFVGSECYPFVKTGGLGDVMYALPRALTRQGADVRVIMPYYACIPEKFKSQMKFLGSFMMDLCQDGHTYFVGIMETELDGVTYNFIENREFFDWGNPYTGLWEDIPKYCYFSKAVLAALNFLEWIPDVIHCHDWQAALTPVYLRTRFAPTPVGQAKSVLTIHNLRFQGICSIDHLKYWSGLPDYLFNYPVFKVNDTEANMFKGGLAFADRITTVSATYAEEIQTGFYGEGLDAHLRYHSPKLKGIVNGIDVDIWNSAADSLLAAPYDLFNAIEKKKENKRALQEALGLDVDENKFVIGLVSRLTDQKGLDLVNAIFQQIMDENTQFALLGTGDPRYEGAFRYYESVNKGSVCSYIQYNEGLAHKIYAGSDALLVPSLLALRPDPADRHALRYRAHRARDRRPEGHRRALQRRGEQRQRLHLRLLRGGPAAQGHPERQGAVLRGPQPLGRDGSPRHGQGRFLGKVRQRVHGAVRGAGGVSPPGTPKEKPPNLGGFSFGVPGGITPPVPRTAPCTRWRTFPRKRPCPCRGGPSRPSGRGPRSTAPWRSGWP